MEQSSNLVTVVIIDEYGKGIPVAWMISNREDAIMLSKFFTAIKSIVGDISPKWLDADNCWKATFGENVTKKLIVVGILTAHGEKLY